MQKLTEFIKEITFNNNKKKLNKMMRMKKKLNLNPNLLNYKEEATTKIANLQN